MPVWNVAKREAILGPSWNESHVHGRLFYHHLRSIAIAPSSSHPTSMITLRSRLLPDDETWEFTFPPNSLTSRPPRAGLVYGKAISLRRSNDEATTTLEMTLRMEQFPSNRILNSDDTSKFVLLSIDRSFRFPEQPMKVGVEYLVRLFKRGVWLNGVQY